MARHGRCNCRGLSHAPRMSRFGHVQGNGTMSLQSTCKRSKNHYIVQPRVLLGTRLAERDTFSGQGLSWCASHALCRWTCEQPASLQEHDTFTHLTPFCACFQPPVSMHAACTGCAASGRMSTQLQAHPPATERVPLQAPRSTPSELGQLHARALLEYLVGIHLSGHLSGQARAGRGTPETEFAAAPRGRPACRTVVELV
jgi:hypothetical protein